LSARSKNNCPGRFLRPARRAVLPILLFIVAALGWSCKTVGRINALDKDSRAFYSQVRYIISAEEQKVFLALPPADRPAFIEDFWKRRDPDPETEKNEFKEGYLARIATANKLFRGGGKDGFIQDRGRILILLGSPDEISTNPVAKYSGARAYETWDYLGHQIRLTFVDMTGDGEYTLVQPDTRALQIINSAQTRLQNPASTGEEHYDFSAEIRQEDSVFALITIPYRNFWLNGKETGPQGHQVSIELTVMDPSGKEIWRHEKDYELASPGAGAEQSPPRDYSIRIPLQIGPGSYSAYLTLDDRLRDKRQYKTWAFTVK